MVLLQEMALKLVQTITKQGTRVSTKENVEMLFDFIRPLVENMPDTSSYDDEVSHAFKAATSVNQEIEALQFASPV